MRKLIVILIAVFLTAFVFAADLTAVEVSFSTLTTMTSTTVSADATYTLALPEFLKQTIIIDTSATAGTITFIAGDYGDSIFGNLVLTPATNSIFAYTPWAMRFQDEDGDVNFKVEGFTSTKIYVITMP